MSVPHQKKIFHKIFLQGLKCLKKMFPFFFALAGALYMYNIVNIYCILYKILN
jgi:hypothetical protein